MNKSEAEKNQTNDYYDESETIDEEEDEFEQARMKNTNLLIVSVAIIALVFLLGLAWVIFSYSKTWSLI